MSTYTIIFYYKNLILSENKILSTSGIRRLAEDAMTQFFLSNSKLSSYLKTLFRIDNGMKRILKLKKTNKQGRLVLKGYIKQ